MERPVEPVVEPMSVEVRAARKRFEVARQAALDLAEVTTLISRIQTGVLPEHEAFYRELASRWGLTAPAVPLQPALLIAKAALQPMAANFSHAAEQLAALQKEQKEALSAPEHRASLLALEALHHTLHETSTARAAMYRRSSALRPQAKILSELLEALQDERRQGAASPARSAAFLASAREALLMVTSILDIELSLEPVSLEGAPPDWPRMDALEQQYRQVHATLLSLADEADARQLELESEYNRALAELHERFG